MKCYSICKHAEKNGYLTYFFKMIYRVRQGVDNLNQRSWVRIPAPDTFSFKMEKYQIVSILTRQNFL